MAAGLVAGLARPGGNLTGVTSFTDVGPKRLELLHELLPASGRRVPVNPADPNLARYLTRDVQAAGRALQVHILNASTESEIDAAFLTLAQLRVGAVIIGADAFFVSQWGQFD